MYVVRVYRDTRDWTENKKKKSNLRGRSNGGHDLYSLMTKLRREGGLVRVYAVRRFWLFNIEASKPLSAEELDEAVKPRP